ncbi:hypothetical protein [Pontibacter arcticus]|uniref:Uncharacterized protein n=1 Tax=Pontibacter arcticus TaxID=2080288 RepID=A0A364RJ16_9BACT|nr:hypothetical protein [Pontibacter arcticus]RAU84320.1 hypothetical protein DP923_04575 [Pontibacter arcticus]
MGQPKYNWLLGLFYFIVFEVVMYTGLSYLLQDMGISNQFQAENTIVPNWVKAIVFIILYLISLLLVVMLVSSRVPSKYRSQLMPWVYLALAGMVVMLFFLF